MSAKDTKQARAIRARAEQAKAELKAQRDAAPDEFLRGDREVPSHSYVRELEGKPGWSRPSGLFVTTRGARPPRKGKHKDTGKPVGRPGNSDAGLAEAVDALMVNRGIDRAAAIAEIARWLVEAEGVDNLKFRAARDRVYLALRNAKPLI